MIITELYGGLGNQMFEYANARALSINLKQELYFDLSFFDTYHRKDIFRLDKFNTNINIAKAEDIIELRRRLKVPRIYRGILKKFRFSPYFNTKYHFDNERIDSCEIEELEAYNNLYISGYFGDQKYFIDIEDIIRKEFTLKRPLNLENEKVLTHIKSSNSVSVHIRRGDYIGNKYFAELPLDYFHNGLKYIERYFPKSTSFIFSDDLKWVKEKLKLKQKTIFVDINNATTDFMDLILMASCKHNIISNSTFSWWAAWLNRNPDKIIVAPNVWFGNKAAQEKYSRGALVPDKWIKL